MDKPGTEAESEDSGTSEDQESSGLEALDESEGTSDEDSEGEASEDSSDTSEVEEEEKWLVPGRFKTEADLLRSYNNLESEFGRRNQELSRLRDKEGKSAPVDPAVEDARFAARVKEKGAVNAFREVAQEAAEPILDEARNTLFQTEYKTLMRNKEFADLEPTMMRIVETNPDLIGDKKLQNDPRLLHLLFLAAKGVKSDQKAQVAEKKGKRKGERDAIKKTKVQIEGSSGSKGRSNVKFEDLTLEQMKKRINSGDTGL